MWPAGQQTHFNCSGHFQRLLRTTGDYLTILHTKKHQTELGKKKVVSVGHPVGVGAPGTGVARKVAPTPPLGFPTGTHTMYLCLTSCRSYTMCDRAWPKEVFFASSFYDTLRYAKKSL